MHDGKGPLEGLPDVVDPSCCPGGNTSRRRALKLIIGGALASAGLPVRGLSEGLLEYRDVLVANLEDLPPGSVKPARFRGMPILVLNRDGTPEVLSAICTHEGCTVEWDAGNDIIVCPCHGGQFDMDGEVLEGPPPAPLIKLPVRVEDGKIYVVE